LIHLIVTQLKSQLKLKTFDIRYGITEVDAGGSGISRDIRETRSAIVMDRFMNQREEMKTQLVRCYQAANDAAGDRILLKSKLLVVFDIREINIG
jgi:hypothetical protein